MCIAKSSYTKISVLIMFILIQSLSDIYVMIAIIVLMEIVRDFIFGGAPKSVQMVTTAMKLKDACSLEEKQ